MQGEQLVQVTRTEGQTCSLHLEKTCVLRFMVFLHSVSAILACRDAGSICKYENSVSRNTVAILADCPCGQSTLVTTFSVVKRKCYLYSTEVENGLHRTIILRTRSVLRDFPLVHHRKHAEICC